MFRASIPAPRSTIISALRVSCPGIGSTMIIGNRFAIDSADVSPPDFEMRTSDASIRSWMFVTKPKTLAWILPGNLLFSKFDLAF